MSVPADTALDLLLAQLRDSLDFYRFAQHHTHDREVSAAFGLAAEVRVLMLKDLQRAGAIGDPAREQPIRSTIRRRATSRCATASTPTIPSRSATSCASARRRSRSWSRPCSRRTPSPGVRRAMKNYFPRVKHCAEMMRRLSHRGDVAA